MCIFCQIRPDDYIEENKLAFVIYDKFPVTQGHSLVIPKRHVPSFFDLEKDEVDAMLQLLQHTKNRLQDSDDLVSCFNVGINDGEEAGQTIPHCHIHLIPRRKKDVEKPQGGVRGVIPEKQAYGN